MFGFLDAPRCREVVDAAEALISELKENVEKARAKGGKHVAAARKQLQNLLNCFDKHGRGNLSLVAAIQRGSEDWLSYLLSAGCQFILEGSSDPVPTYIHEAVRCSQSQMAIELCEISPELVNAVDRDGRTTIHAAVLGGDLDLLEALADVSRRPSKTTASCEVVHP